MKRTHVRSQAVDSIGYQGTTLEVAFEGGGVYDYFDVPEGVYRDFLAAESKGHFFQDHVLGRFEYLKK